VIDATVPGQRGAAGGGWWRQEIGGVASRSTGVVGVGTGLEVALRKTNAKNVG
jgi:hypothetical protein